MGMSEDIKYGTLYNTQLNKYRENCLILNISYNDYSILILLKNYLYSCKYVIFTAYKIKHVLKKNIIFKIEADKDCNIYKILVKCFVNLSNYFIILFITFNKI